MRLERTGRNQRRRRQQLARARTRFATGIERLEGRSCPSVFYDFEVIAKSTSDPNFNGGLGAGCR
jgi:hypothetical protein